MPATTTPSKSSGFLVYGVLMALVILVPLLLIAFNDKLFPENKKLPNQPALKMAILESPLFLGFYVAGVERVTLDCDTDTRKLSATFNFEPLEGRAPVTVSRGTVCKGSGKVVQWGPYGETSAEENYAPALVLTELTALVAKASLKAHTGRRMNEELGKVLSPFIDQARAKQVASVTFICEEVGKPYQYRGSYSWNSGLTGKLKTICTAPHQNFKVTMTGMPTSSPDYPQYMVEQYNAIDAEKVKAVYAEFLVGPPKQVTSF